MSLNVFLADEVAVYIGESGTFTCNAGPNLYPAWQVDSSVSFPQHDVLDEPSKGVYATQLNSTAANRSSTLTIEGRLDTNNTVIKCTFYEHCCTVNFDMNTLHIIFVVYGELKKLSINSKQGTISFISVHFRTKPGLDDRLYVQSFASCLSVA